MVRSALRSTAAMSLPKPEADFDDRGAVLEIMLETGAYTGTHYFEKLTESIARYFGVDGVYLAELTLDLQNGRILALHESESASRPQDPFAKGGLCEFILEQGTAIQSRSIVPFRKELRALQAGTFVGTTLHAHSGDPIGVLYLLHDTEIARPNLAGSVLQQLAPRVAAEIERRQQELSMRRSEARLRLLTDRSQDALFYYQLEPHVRIQYVSPAIERIFGQPAEAFHANPNLIFEILDAEQRASLEAALTSGSEEPFITSVELPGAGRRWVEYRDFPIREDGKLVAVGGTIRDITRRIEAEEALKLREHYLSTMLNSIPDTLLLVRSDGEVVDYKPGEVNTGLGNPANVKGRNLKDLMSPAIVGVLERAVRASSRMHRLQHVLFDVPGDRARHYDVTCLPFGDDALLLVLRDLTMQDGQATGQEPQYQQGKVQGNIREAELLERPLETRRKSNAYALTEREMAVLDLIVEGMADKQIADALGISIFTVNKHVGNILGKMNAVSRTEAGVRAIRESLLPRKPQPVQ